MVDDASGCRHQIVQLVPGESDQLQPARLPPIEVGERRPQSVGRMLARVATTQDQQYRRVDERTREVTKQ